MADAWSLVKGAASCEQCGSEFRRREAYFSAITDEGDSFARRDFCVPCWEQARQQTFFSFWKTCRRGDRRPARIDTQVVLDFFHKLQEAGADDKRQLRFVLALYLARRRTLKFHSVRRENGRDVLVFRRPRHNDTYEVDDPQMSEEQINAATERLKELFQTQL